VVIGSYSTSAHGTGGAPWAHFSIGESEKIRSPNSRGTVRKSSPRHHKKSRNTATAAASLLWSRDELHKWWVILIKVKCLLLFERSDIICQGTLQQNYYQEAKRIVPLHLLLMQWKILCLLERSGIISQSEKQNLEENAVVRLHLLKRKWSSENEYHIIPITRCSIFQISEAFKRASHMPIVWAAKGIDVSQPFLLWEL